MSGLRAQLEQANDELKRTRAELQASKAEAAASKDRRKEPGKKKLKKKLAKAGSPNQETQESPVESHPKLRRSKPVTTRAERCLAL